MILMVLTLPEILRHLVLLRIFIADLIARFLSPLIHLLVVLAHVLRRVLLRGRVRAQDLWLGVVLRTFRLLSGVGGLRAAFCRSAATALALLGWGRAGVLLVGRGVGALLVGVLALGIALA